MRSHNFDAEAIAIRGEEICCSQNRGDETKLYRFPKIPGVYKTNPSQSLSVDSLVQVCRYKYEYRQPVVN